MKILMINKFLYPNGGSETYIFRLGDYLKSQGHEVEYFGMEHEGRCVSNRAEAYTSDMDFHEAGTWTKLTYPLRVIYSREARRKIREELDAFCPDVCHVNNFNYQLTPSILLEIVRWRKQTGHFCRIIFTAHDYQLVCPNHMMNNPNTKENCEKCLGSHYMNCLRGRCIHGSAARSAIGVMEALYWKTRKTYRYFDKIICCSDFLKHKFDTDPLLAAKTVAMHNFVKKTKVRKVEKKDYVLYFGRYSEEKGIGTLLEVCRSLPDIPFVFAGKGPLEDSVNAVPNIRNAGFQSGEELEMLIRQARFSIYPSEWYENCPFSVMESQMYGTPVIGARIGGIPELIQDGKNGELFDSGNAADLAGRIRGLWENREQLKKYTEACSADVFDTVEEYCEKLVPVYEGTDIGA